MFIKEYQFRYSDLNKHGAVKTSTVLELLQDISFSHASFVGLNTEKMLSVHTVCLLGGWKILFAYSLDPNRPTTVKTGIMSIGKCEATRKYEIWQNAKCCVIATAIWFTLDTSRHMITRVPREYISAFESVSEPDNKLPYGKLTAVENAELCQRATVENRDIDTNNHLNNVKSAELVLDLLPEDFNIAELQVKYSRELTLGEEMAVYKAQTENGWFFEIKNLQGDTCVQVHTQDIPVNL